MQMGMGKYSVDFIMEDGEWKIWHMTIYPLFQSEYGEGWADNPTYVSEAFAFPNAGPEKPIGIMTEMNCILPMNLPFLNPM